MTDQVKDHFWQGLLGLFGAAATADMSGEPVLAASAGVGGIVLGLIIKVGQQLVRTLRAQQESQVRIEEALVTQNKALEGLLDLTRTESRAQTVALQALAVRSGALPWAEVSEVRQ